MVVFEVPFDVRAGSGGRKCSEPAAADDTAPPAAARHTLRLLARRIQHLTEEINDLTARITSAIAVCAPQLLDRYEATVLVAAINEWL